MKKLVVVFSVFCFLFLLGVATPMIDTAEAAKPEACVPTGPENDAISCCDGIDNDCDRKIDSRDKDCSAITCGGVCNENDTRACGSDVGECQAGTQTCIGGAWGDCVGEVGPTTEICDALDNDCNGSVDDGITCGGHDTVTGTFNTPADVTAKCLECHASEGFDSLNSLHGMMPTPAPSVVNTSGDSQKLSEINTFCSYPNPELAGAACLACHPTLGKWQNMTASDIDCLRCHNDAYKRKFAAEPDSANYINVVDWQGTAKTYIPSARDANGEFYVEFDWNAMPGMTATDLIAGVHLPTTSTCLSCHAKAGGGDWTKRGDLGLSTNDPSSAEDVHLASVAKGGAGLSCSSCHIPTSHEIPGRGIDLRPEEGGSVKACVDCHPGMDSGGGHAASGKRSEPDRHVARVACQSCHIPAFGKGGATEVSRNWLEPHWNNTLCNGQGAWVGFEDKQANVVPEYVFFDGTSYVYALGQVLEHIDPVSGLDLVANANGGIHDALGTSKLVPIKRHWSNMAVMSSGADTGKVIPFDVVWQFMTGLSDEAAERGKQYAGYSGSHEWKKLEAEMAINHGVSPAANVADCSNCHERDFELETTNKLDKLGYHLKDADKDGVIDATDKTIICSQCHGEKSFKSNWEQMHAHTGKGSGIGCTFCHDIDRAERGLCEPCNPDGSENTACINEFVDTNYYDHCAQ
ncbi:MAG TPA: hypothetical protein DCO77_11560 [Nitrospiraceae bacterium]|nr:hypothetical protein [Nitrospiraceae bacterium]